MTHPDSQKLFDILVPFAQKMLRQNGTFAPFGGSVDTDGAIGLCAASPEHPERSTEEMLDAMHRGLRSRAEKSEIRGAAICFDTRISQPPNTTKVDAICVHVEHRGEKPVDLYVPYSKGFLGKYTYQDVFGTGADAQIFVDGGTL